MKAVVVREFGAPEQMKVEELPVPSPGRGEVLVRVRAAGVNPVDTYIRTGTHAQKPQLPYTPGKDASGVVEDVGEGVRLLPGKRVYTADSLTGTYAEYCLCREDQVFELPDNVTFEQGAGVFVPYATSYRALFQKAEVVAGETVLVHGASGGVGIAAVQWAKAFGLSVIGTAGTDEGRGLVEAQGADHVFDHTKDDYLAGILAATEGKGVDVILEMLANENLSKDFDVLAKHGRIVVIGNRGSLEFNPRLAMGKDASIHGMVLFNASSEELEQIHRAIGAGLRDGFLFPAVGRAFSLEEAPVAHHAVVEQRAFGKIVLLP
jgi:NADPH2:quinone reductase